MPPWFCSTYLGQLVQHQAPGATRVETLALQGIRDPRDSQGKNPRTCQLAAVLSKANGNSSANAALAEHRFAPK